MKKILLSLALATFGLTVNSYAQTIMSQNFTGTTVPGMPSGWTAAHTGAGNGWQTTTSATDLYFGTVSNAAPHTEYAVVDDYGTPGNDPATMTSPSFSLVGVSSPYFSFDYVYFEAYLSGPPVVAEQAWVSISTDGGTTWALLDSLAPLSSSAWSSVFINMSAYTGSANCMLRFNYTDNGSGIIGAAIGNVKVFNAEANDIAITAVTPVAGASNDYFLTGSNVTFAGTMLNNSPSAISSFQASYSVAGGTPVTQTFTASVAAFGTYNFTFSTPYSVPSVGNQPVQVWVTEAGDPELSNDTMNTAINGVSFMPTKRLMFEEPTGSWCGYCVRGIVFMDSLWRLYPDNVSVVSVHDYNGYDLMAQENTLTQHYDSYMSSMISGFPSIVVDRSVVDDPSNALVDYTAMNGNFGFANMTVSCNFTPTAITASASVTPALDLSGDYRLELVLTEDNVHSTLSAYAQHNYYSSTNPGGSAGTLYGSGYNFVDSLPVIPASSMYYKFVDRYTVPDLSTSPNGVAGSLPSSMTAGTAYNYTFTSVTPQAAGADGPAWNVNNMRAVVMLIDNNPSNPTYGQVLNSALVTNPLITTLGTANVAADVEALRVFPNPATGIAHATFGLGNAGNVQFSIVDVLGRTVFSVPSETMNAGKQQINFSTADLAAGVYNVVITTEAGTETQKLSVIK